MIRYRTESYSCMQNCTRDVCCPGYTGNDCSERTYNPDQILIISKRQLVVDKIYTIINIMITRDIFVIKCRLEYANISFLTPIKFNLF